MFQAEIHLQQDKECVVSKLTTELDENLDIAIEKPRLRKKTRRRTRCGG